MTERAWYKGSQVIETQPRPWERDFSQNTDCATLAMCDCQVVAAVQESQMIPQQGPTPPLVTPSYLANVTPFDNAVISVQMAMEVSAALPYARG